MDAFDLDSVQPPPHDNTSSSLGFPDIPPSTYRSPHDLEHQRLRARQATFTDYDDDCPELLLQPETCPKSYEQMLCEAEATYYGRIMVEEKCIDTEQGQGLSDLLKTPLYMAALHSSYVKKALPMVINDITVPGRHDTGAEGNFMSHELALRLGLRIRINDGESQPFSMGNGRLIRSIGKARTRVTFANEPETSIKCRFNILPKLTASLIMGSKFLKVTQTLSKFKHRLQACAPLPGCLPSINLIGSTTVTKSRFFCFVDGLPTYVNADSASDLDLMSSAYVKVHGCRLHRRLRVRKRVQLADGTVAQTIGQVTAMVELEDGYRYRRTFDVLPGLTSDVLFGDEFLNKIDAFASYEDSFVNTMVGCRHLELNVLVSLGPVNDYLKGKFWPWIRQSPVLSDTASTEAKRLDDQDWREMLRHDREAARIDRELTGQVRLLAQRAEAQRVADYEQQRNRTRSGYLSPSAGAGPPTLPVRSPYRPPVPAAQGIASPHLQRYRQQQPTDSSAANSIYTGSGPSHGASAPSIPPPVAQRTLSPPLQPHEPQQRDDQRLTSTYTGPGRPHTVSGSNISPGRHLAPGSNLRRAG